MSKVKQVEEGTSEDLSFLGEGEIGTWYFITILLSTKQGRGASRGDASCLEYLIVQPIKSNVNNMYAICCISRRAKGRPVYLL